MWHFVAKKAAPLGKRIEGIPANTMNALVEYEWPGNVRELENVIERAIILSPGSTLQLRDSFKTGRAAPPAPKLTRGSLEETERKHIVRVLEDCGWTIKGEGNAADRLGLKPSTLRFRMKKLGIERPR